MKTYDVPDEFKNVGFSITKGEVVQLKTISKDGNILAPMDTSPSNEGLTLSYYSDGSVYENGKLIN